MSSRNWSDDHELMRDLGEALTSIPAEQQVVDAARTAYGWRSLSADLELAALLYDSDLDQTTLVRGPVPGSPRALVFGRGSRRVEIELSETGIEGQLVPPEPGVVRLLTAAGSAAETTAVIITNQRASRPTGSNAGSGRQPTISRRIAVTCDTILILPSGDAGMVIPFV